MFLFLLLTATAQAAMPLWISEGSFQKYGNTLTLVCSGKGKSISIARSEAMNSCVQSAGEQLPTTWKLKSHSQETDEDVSLKKEVTADQRIEGLSCDVQKEFIDTNSENPVVYVKCRFNLAKAKSTALNMEKITAAHAVSLDVRPGCDRIYVTGGPYGREVICEEGKPTVITIIPGENSVSIIKEGGFRAQRIKLNPNVSYQEYIVHLEKRNAHSDDWMNRMVPVRPMRPDEVDLGPMTSR